MKPLQDDRLKAELDNYVDTTNCLSSARCRRAAGRVLTEIMGRARKNVDRIVARLNSTGYRFAQPDLVHVVPVPNLRRKIERIEKSGAILPLAIKYWFKIVGSVDLAGSHPKWKWPGYSFPGEGHRDWMRNKYWLTDPLEVFAQSLDFEYYSWKEAKAFGAVKPFRATCLEISGEDCLKANLSGGETYHFRLDTPAVDSILFGEPHNVRFVD
jgi:hypothetical protein